MSAHWDSYDACDRFEAHDSLAAQVLGYPFVFRALGLEAAELSMPNGEDLRLFDYYWPKPVYRALLGAAGFQHIRMQEPTLRDAVTSGIAGVAELATAWEEAPTQPPFMIFTGER